MNACQTCGAPLIDRSPAGNKRFCNRKCFGRHRNAKRTSERNDPPRVDRPVLADRLAALLAAEANGTRAVRGHMPIGHPERP